MTSYYPFEMPGGIQLLGRLPVPLFDLSMSNPAFPKSPSICKISDRIKFRPIDKEEYEEIERNFKTYEYDIQPGLFEFELKENKDD